MLAKIKTECTSDDESHYNELEHLPLSVEITIKREGKCGLQFVTINKQNFQQVTINQDLKETNQNNEVNTKMGRVEELLCSDEDDDEITETREEQEKRMDSTLELLITRQLDSGPPIPSGHFLNPDEYVPADDAVANVTSDSEIMEEMSCRTVYKCDICDKSFKLKSNLADHIYMHIGHKPYKCEICNKCFSHKSNLVGHKYTHTAYKPHKCHICNKLFSNKSHLNSHLHIHTGYKPHKCDTCNKSFLRRSHLVLHQNIHIGYRPHKCDKCGKAFLDKSQLTAHQHTHTGFKPHRCHICDKSYLRNSHLVTHVLMHAGYNPHKCGVCNKVFSHRSSLKRHQLTNKVCKPLGTDTTQNLSQQNPAKCSAYDCAKQLN